MPLLKAEYINHNGKSVTFGDGEGLFLNEHDLRNYSWNVQTRGNRIISVNRKGVKEHNLPVVIAAHTEIRAKELADKLFSVFETDLLANKKGRILINGYNLRCFIYGQEYSEWSNELGILKVKSKIICDSIWYKPLEAITFNTANIILPTPIDLTDVGASPAGEEATDEWTGGEKGYFHGYPYDYPSTLEEYIFENTAGVPLSWEAVIFGAASVIEFYIGNSSTSAHKYEVRGVTLADGEWLKITAKEALDEKTIFKYAADGTRTNCFANRSSTSYLFEPIPIGSNVVMSTGNLKWRLIPIVERSTPEWL